MPGRVFISRQYRLPSVIQQKIRPAVYIQLQAWNARDCESFHALCNLFADIGRADFFSRIRLIFVCIVKQSVFGNDFDRRKCLSVDHAAGKFAAFDVSFDDHFVFITERIFQCLYGIPLLCSQCIRRCWNRRSTVLQRPEGQVPEMPGNCHSSSLCRQTPPGVSTPACWKTLLW